MFFFLHGESALGAIALDRVSSVSGGWYDAGSARPAGGWSLTGAVHGGVDLLFRRSESTATLPGCHGRHESGNSCSRPALAASAAGSMMPAVRSSLKKSICNMYSHAMRLSPASISSGWDKAGSVLLGPHFGLRGKEEHSGPVVSPCCRVLTLLDPTSSERQAFVHAACTLPTAFPTLHPCISGTLSCIYVVPRCSPASSSWR